MVAFYTRVILYASFTEALLAGFTTIVDVALTIFSIASTQARRGHGNLDLQLGLQIDANVGLSVLDDEFCCCCIHARCGIGRRDAKRKLGSSEVQNQRKRFLKFEFELIIRSWVLVLESKNVKSLGSRILGPLSRSDFPDRSKIRSESPIELYSMRKIEKTVAASMCDEIVIAVVIFFFTERNFGIDPRSE